MTKLLFSLALGLFFFSVITAQAAPPRPTAPYLAKLPADTSWRVDFTPRGSPGSEAQTPGHASMEKELLVIRIGNVRRDLITWSDGTKTELWASNKVIFVKAPQNAQYGIYLPGSNPYGDSYPDFPDLGWIDLNHFKDLETKNGELCFTYFTSQRPGPFYATMRGEKFGPATVWVSVTTKLPVAWEGDQLSGVYTFNLSPSAIALPDECQKVVDAIDAGEKRMAGQKMMLPP